jgi:two-component system KDP operon response regulator KdpE
MSLKPVKVLVLDHDPAMRRMLRSFLVANGYMVEEARTWDEARKGARRSRPDLVLLEVEMPGFSGIEACRRLRFLAPRAGIVIITVCDREDIKIQTLEAGADDYLTKPFSIRELMARLHAISRRRSLRRPTDAILQDGELELDLERHLLRKAGVEVHLSPTEFGLLSYLMQHANVPIEHGRLLRAIWGSEYGCEMEYLRTYIKRLRKKIERDALNPEYLLTVPWHGYRFCGQEERQESLPERVSHATDASASWGD